jgi:hypothetical protein
MLTTQPMGREDVPDAPPVTGNNVPKFIDEPNLKSDIIEKIRDGHHPYTVARFCGILPETFMEWMKRGADGFNKDYYDFYIDVMSADAESEMAGIAQIQLQSYDQWTARAWLLERRYPERWGRQQAVKHDHNHNISGDATITIKNQLSTAVLNSAEVRNALRYIDVTDAEYEES